MVTSNVLRNPDISLRDKGLYSYLATYANSDNILTVSINRAANECGVDESTIKRILDQLKKQGIIVREQREHGKSYKTTLLK